MYVITRLYDSVVERIKQQGSDRWFAGSKPWRNFNNTPKWTPFQMEFLEQRKS